MPLQFCVEDIVWTSSDVNALADLSGHAISKRFCNFCNIICWTAWTVWMLFITVFSHLRVLTCTAMVILGYMLLTSCEQISARFPNVATLVCVWTESTANPVQGTPLSAIPTPACTYPACNARSIITAWCGCRIWTLDFILHLNSPLLNNLTF